MSDWTKGNIVSLADYRCAKEMPAILTVRKYWQSLRLDGQIPKSSDVDPLMMLNALEFAFIIERSPVGTVRFRQAGLHLVDVMGMAVRGMPFATLFALQSREEVADVLTALFLERENIELTLSSPAAFGRSALNAMLILLPLRNDFGTVDRALGCFVSSGSIGYTPRRFIVKKLVKTPLSYDTDLDQGAFEVRSESSRPPVAKRRLSLISFDDKS